MSSSDDSFIESLTNVLQYTSSIAINLNKQFFGIDCKVYYPRGSGHYSGKHDDLDFPEEPDTEIRLLIPEIYETRKFPEAGIQDNLQVDQFTLYAEKDLYLPFHSLIVTNSTKLGCRQFLSKDTDTISTNIDSIYKEIQLVPYLNFRNNDEDIELNTEKLVEQWNEENKEHETEDGIPVDTDMSVAKYKPSESTAKKWHYRKIT